MNTVINVSNDCNGNKKRRLSQTESQLNTLQLFSKVFDCGSSTPAVHPQGRDTTIRANSHAPTTTTAINGVLNEIAPATVRDMKFRPSDPPPATVLISTTATMPATQPAVFMTLTVHENKNYQGQPSALIPEASAPALQDSHATGPCSPGGEYEPGFSVIHKNPVFPFTRRFVIWKPSSLLTDMSLQQLTHETGLQLSQESTGVRFVFLRGRGRERKVFEVAHGDEEGYRTMKSYVYGKINECQQPQASNTAMPFLLRIMEWEKCPPMVSQHAPEPVAGRRLGDVQYQKKTSSLIGTGTTAELGYPSTHKTSLMDAAAPATPTATISTLTVGLAQNADIGASVPAADTDTPRSGVNAKGFRDTAPMPVVVQHRRANVAPKGAALDVQPATPAETSQVGPNLDPPIPPPGAEHLYTGWPRPSLSGTQAEQAVNPDPLVKVPASITTRTINSPGLTGSTPLLQNRQKPAAQENKETIQPLLPAAVPQMTKASATKSLHTAASMLRIVVRSRQPRTANYWTPTKPFQRITLAELKQDIPLALSLDFWGFQFGFVCSDGTTDRSEGKTVVKIQDGDEIEFKHMKINVFESMHEYMEESEGSGEAMIFQLRVEEIRGAPETVSLL